MTSARAARRAVAAVASGALLSTVLVGGAGAGPGDVVLNPGPVTMTVDAGGFFNVAGNDLSLPSTATLPQCSDGINNDVAVDNPASAQDTNIDFDGVPKDAQCNSLADDSEVKAGVQPRQYITLSGNVDQDGNINVPQGSVSFPPFYVFSDAGGAIDVLPTPLSDATGTLDPATGEASLSLDWQLRVAQNFFRIDCVASISMDLSSDPGNAANSGSIPVTPSPYNTTTGDVTVTGNTFAIAPFVPNELVSGTTGAATAASTTFTDPNGSFQAGNWNSAGTGGDVNKQITIVGAGPGGADLNTQIAGVTNATTITLADPAGTSVDPASYSYSASTQSFCDTVGSGFGIDPGTGAPSGNSAAQLSVTSDVVFQSGAAAENSISGTLTAPGGVVPADGVLVTLFPENGVFTAVESTTTDSNGDYTFTGMADGNYKIRYWDFAGRFAKGYYSSQPTNKTADLINVAGNSAATADQELSPRNGGAIAGRILEDGTGTPIVDVTAQVYSVTDGYVGANRTGANGYFNVADLPPGDYTVRFVDPSGAFVSEWWQNRSSGFNADPVTVAASKVSLNVGMAPVPPSVYPVVLSGLNEVPSQANGYSGSGDVTIAPGTDQACVDLTLDLGGEAITGLHIHQANAGVNGGVVVNFAGNPNTCVAISGALADAIVANPAGYYVNVHTATYPGGAVRAQLS